MISISPEMSLAHRLIVTRGSRALFDALSPEERLALMYSLPAWERPSLRLPPLPEDSDLKEPGWGRWTGQQEPPGRWRYWILCAGRSFGKSWRLSHFIMSRAKRFPGCRIALVAQTVTSLWRDCVGGKSGLVELAPPWFAPKLRKNGKSIAWPNGSETYLFTAEEPKSLKGPNNDFAAVEELCAQPYAEAVWTELKLTMRSGDLPQTIVATTPDPPIPLLVTLIQHRSSAVTFGSTLENRGNVSEAWLQEEVMPLLGTHVGSQQIEGRIVREVPGALFVRAWFKREKWCPGSFKPSKYRRIGVGIDPARTSGHKADSWGIVKAGQREDGIIEVMVDATVNATSDVAMQRALDVFYEEPPATFMVADKGAGGEMVNGLVRLAGGRGINVIGKPGTRGKRAWAEGAAVLYGRHLVFHAPGLHELEEECCTWTDDSKKSPNRMDALAYVVGELSGHRQLSQAGLNSSPVSPRRM